MIALRNVNYQIKSTEILKDITLTIGKGEMAAIIGPNGAGKSTLLRIILGMIKGFTGEIRIENIPQREWLRRNSFGYLPQHEVFDRNFPASAQEIVLMGAARSRGVFRCFTKKDAMHACEQLERVGMLHACHKQIGDLSGGELQRVFLARALLSGTEYLFLDEPEASIDKSGISLFFNILNDLHKEGKTILTVSHDVANTMKTCTMLICLNKTLHCHTQPELVTADIIKRTYGEVMRIIERK